MSRGDIAVFFDNQKAERRQVSNAEMMYLTIFPIGRDGVNPDLYMKDEPDKGIQFTWWRKGAEEQSLNELEDNYDAGYQFVVKEKGWVNQRWNWNEEGHLVNGPNHCMWRPGELWAEARNKRLGLAEGRINDSYEQGHAMAEAIGVGSFEQRPGGEIKQVVQPAKKLNL